MSADKKLGVKIEIEADNSGAQKAQEALKDVTDQANSGADATSDLTKESDKLSDSLKDGAAKGEKFELTHRNIHMITRELVKDMPELGEVLSELSNPWMGLTFAMAAVISKMVEYQGHVNEMLNRPGPDWDTDTKKLDDMRQAYEDVNLSGAAFQRQLDEMREKQRTPEEATNKKLEALKQQSDAEDALLTKMKERNEAGIDSAEQMGLITHAQAIAAKLQMDEQYAQKRIELENKVEQAQTWARQQEREQNVVNAHVAGEELPRVTKQAGAAHAADKRNSDELETAKSNLDKALEERKKIQEDIADTQREAQNGDSKNLGIWLAKKFGANIYSPEEALKSLDDKNESNEGSIRLLQTKIKKGTEAEPQLKDNSAQADETVDALKAKIKAYTSRINELDALIPDMQHHDAVSATSRSNIAQVEHDTSAIKALPQSAAMSLDSHNQIAKDVGNLLGTLNTNQSSLINTMRGHARNAALQQSAIQKLADDMATIQNQMRHSPPYDSGH